MKPFWKVGVKFYKYFKVLLLVLVAVLLAYHVAVLIGSAGISEKESLKQEHQVYLVDNGVHVDLVVPSVFLDSLKSFLPDDRVLSSRYVGIGWGEKDFYLKTPTWDDAKASVIAKALLYPTPAVFHFTAYGSTLNQTEDCREFFMEEKQLHALDSLLVANLKINEENKVQAYQAEGYSDINLFVDAKGKYSAFLTCNEWINDLLDHLGEKSCLWSPYPWGIMKQYR